MKKRHILYILIPAILLALVIVILILIQTSYQTNNEITTPISNNISQQNDVEANQDIKFTLVEPNVGNSSDQKILFTVANISKNVKLEQNEYSVKLSDDTFNLTINTSMGEKGGLYDGMINKTTINSGLGDIDRYQSTIITDMKSITGSSFPNYYFYTNMYGECAIPVSFCGVTEISLNTESDLGYNTNLTIYCNASDSSVAKCDEVIKNLKLNGIERI